MVQNPDWQKFVSRAKELASRAKELLPDILKTKPNWQNVLKRCLPYVLVAVFASAMTFAVLAARDTKSESRDAGIEETLTALEESKKELEQTLAETEKLIDQLLTRNESMQTLLEQAEREESEMADVIQNLLNAYNTQNQKWVMPIKYVKCTSYFGLRKHPVEGESKFHYGVDLAAPQGTPIVATRGGTVTTAAYEADGAGNYVIIDHMDGFSSRYLHMAKYIVTPGQVVIPGQVIGYCGSTGASTGAHLHFSVYENDKPVDPADYIDI